MRRGGLFVALGLALLVVGQLARHVGGVTLFELGRSAEDRLPEDLLARLGALKGPLLVTYLTLPEEDLPAEFRGQREHVLGALELLSAAAAPRLRSQCFDPTGDPAQESLVRELGAEPFRARRIQRDGWSESAVWAHLGFSAGEGPTLWLGGVPMDSVAEAARWIVTGLEETARPRGVRVAVAGRTEALARALTREGAEVIAVESAEDLAEAGAELLFLVAPPRIDGAWIDALREHLDRGRNAVVAASPWSARASAGTVELVPASPGIRALFEAFGIEASAGPLLDPVCTSEFEGGTELPQPWRLRCLATAQDHRSLLRSEGREPGGALVFEAAVALEARLDSGAGRRAHVVASSSPAARPTPETSLSLNDLRSREFPSGARSSLALHLVPTDPLRGELLVAGSPTPWIELEDEFHAALLRGNLNDLASFDTRVRTGALPGGRAPRVRPGSGLVLAWRGIFLLVGFALLLRPLLRLRFHGGLLLIPLALAALFAVSIGARFVPRLGTDTTRAERHTLPRGTRAALATAKGPLSIELFFGTRLPFEWRAAHERLVLLARGAARTSAQVELFERGARAARQEDVEPVSVRENRGATSMVREVYAHVRVSSSDLRVEWSVPNAEALERSEARLALTLARLCGTEVRSVVLASDVPRLSPAEALLEYQRKGRFAPIEGDVYGAAHTLLQELGLGVRRVDPGQPGSIDPGEVLVWLQPRREIGPMLGALRDHLAAGGRALVAAQHFDVVAQRLDGPRAPLSFWPRPLFPDIGEAWLEELGVQLQRVVLLDRRSATGTERGAAAEGARPFLLREEASVRPEHPWTRGLGDLYLPSPAPLGVDPQLLSDRGLRSRVLFSSSPESWTFDWKGGALPAEVLRVPDTPGDDAAAPIGLDLEGRFGPGTDAEGRLLLIGSSGAFRAGALEREEFSNAEALAALVLGLAAGDDAPALATRSSTAPGLPELEGGERLRTRFATLLAGPLLVFALVTLVRWRRRIA